MERLRRQGHGNILARRQEPTAHDSIHDESAVTVPPINGPAAPIQEDRARTPGLFQGIRQYREALVSRDDEAGYAVNIRGTPLGCPTDRGRVWSGRWFAIVVHDGWTVSALHDPRAHVGIVRGIPLDGNRLTVDELANAQAPNPNEVFKGLERVLEVISVAGTRDHFTKEQSPAGVPWAKTRRGGAILRDKGLMYNGISAHATAKEVILYANGPQVNVQQFGATIKAKPGKALAIPLTKEAKRIGSPRKNNFPRPLFVWKSGSGHAFLAERTGKDGLRLQYILLQSVTIPARPFLGWSAETLAKIERILLDRYTTKVAGMFTPRVSYSLAP